ncbi:MAG: glycosyltransferase family 4 protein [Planctomycetota bacterium]|nr:glycosyltransferase family 4 protein [Planctomycetota bacterium]
MRDGKTRVLVIGPTPPPHHGVAAFTRDLLAQAHDPRFELLHLDTSDRRDASNTGKWDATNLRLGFANLAELAGRCLKSGIDLVYVPISQNVPAFLRDALFILESRLLWSKVVLHLHGGYFRNVYDHPSVAPDGQERAGPLDPLFRGTARTALNAAAAVIVLGNRFRPIFKGLVPDERIHVVENGVPDPGAWDLRQSAPPPDLSGARGGSGQDGTLLYMSTLTRTKGIVDLIHAIAMLKTVRPNVRLKVAGTWSDEAAQAEARALIERERLQDNVLFCGTVEGPEKAAFLSSGDIFCLPTRYPYEGQPLVLLEAMAAGLPVLATDHGVIAETVLDGVTGRLLARDAPTERLAAALERMLSDPKTLLDWGARGRNRYLERYALSLCHQRLFEVFQSAVRKT